jgi:murein DD-endopeptidase MepM/ murein hydrolase activator NlpD
VILDKINSILDKINSLSWIAYLAITTMVTLVSTSGGTSVALADSAAQKRVVIDADQSYGSAVRFLLTTSQLNEGTVSLKLEQCENLTSSQPTPVEFVILKPYNRFEFFRLTQKTEGAFNFKWSFHYKVGMPSKLPTVDYIYTLPYSPSEHHLVTQSYFGEHSHFKGSETEYAVDFAMPEGTVVKAARPGQVVEYRDDSNVGGDSPNFKDDANEVVIKHGDGTYGAYVHLKQGGVLVKLGQQVSVGTPIALSGNTGWSTRPHLHFGIFRVNSGTSITSLPFKMRTDSGVMERLFAGQVY